MRSWEAPISGSSILSQPRQPLPGILDFRKPGVGVLPEVEESAETFVGLLFLFLLFPDLH